MLVPITSSLYVPGETSALQSCMVDVGTGYYIEKSVGASAIASLSLSLPGLGAVVKPNSKDHVNAFDE